MIEKRCTTCGKVFKTIPSVIKKGGGKYCSKKCHYLKNPKVKKTCKTCKKVFYVIPAQKNVKKYCSKNCYSESQQGKPAWNKGIKTGKPSPRKGQKFPQFSGKNCPLWKGGKAKSGKGYILILKPNHPFCTNHGYVREHRLVMEKKHGCYLTPKEVVHHIDKNPRNNNIENLMLFASSAEHLKYHALLRKKK